MLPLSGPVPLWGRKTPLDSVTSLRSQSAGKLKELITYESTVWGESVHRTVINYKLRTNLLFRLQTGVSRRQWHWLS